MSPELIEKLSALTGTFLVSVFVLGLAYSISTGAAGFWGGLPFWVICFGILPLILFDFWDTCYRKKP